MKKSYITPKTCAVPLKGPVLMVQGSQTVNGYENEKSFTIGDTDEP